MRTPTTVYDLPDDKLWRLQFRQRVGLLLAVLGTLCFAMLLPDSWWWLIGFLPAFFIMFALVLVGVVYDQEHERRAKFWPRAPQ